MFLDRNKGRKQILFRQQCFRTWENRETLIGHMMFLQQCFLVCSGLYTINQIPKIEKFRHFRNLFYFAFSEVVCLPWFQGFIGDRASHCMSVFHKKICMWVSYCNFYTLNSVKLYLN